MKSTKKKVTKPTDPNHLVVDTPFPPRRKSFVVFNRNWSPTHGLTLIVDVLRVSLFLEDRFPQFEARVTPAFCSRSDKFDSAAGIHEAEKRAQNAGSFAVQGRIGDPVISIFTRSLMELVHRKTLHFKKLRVPHEVERWLRRGGRTPRKRPSGLSV